MKCKCRGFGEKKLFCGAGAYRVLPLVDVAAADGGGDDLDADLHGPRRGDLHVLHHQRLPRPPCHGRCTTPNTDESGNAHIRASEQGSGGDGLPRQVMAAGGEDDDAAAIRGRFG
jgi:hypothetical protein